MALSRRGTERGVDGGAIVQCFVLRPVAANNEEDGLAALSFPDGNLTRDVRKQLKGDAAVLTACGQQTEEDPSSGTPDDLALLSATQQRLRQRRLQRDTPSVNLTSTDVESSLMTLSSCIVVTDDSIMRDAHGEVQEEAAICRDQLHLRCAASDNGGDGCLVVAPKVDYGCARRWFAIPATEFATPVRFLQA